MTIPLFDRSLYLKAPV